MAITIGVVVAARAWSGVAPVLSTISLNVGVFIGRRVSDMPNAFA